MSNDLLDRAAANGFAVVRTWGFAEADQCGGGAVYFQCWNGSQPVYNTGPTGLQKLDYVVAAARQRGLRLIITLTNNWPDFGGMDAYVRWRGTGVHSTFYSDPIIQSWYKAYVTQLLNRVNIYTNTAYKNEPAIMAWELANESRCGPDPRLGPRPGCTAATITTWAATMSTHIKQIDPNHLVGVGDEGFYCTPGAPDWTENCSEGVDTLALTNLSTIDYMSLHLYPDPWGKTPDWGTSWIIRHIRDGHDLNKPVLLGEFGYQLHGGQRNAVYEAWTDAVYANDGDGDLFWMLAGLQDNGTPYPDYDGYTIYCPSPLCTLLSNHARQMRTRVVDDLNDFSRIAYRLACLGFDTTNLQFFDGDPSRMDRDCVTSEWAVWALPGMTRFQVDTFFQSLPGNHFAFYVSPDNSAYTPITPTMTLPVGYWWRIRYTFNPPVGTNYVKVVYPATGLTYSPQIGRVIYTDGPR